MFANKYENNPDSDETKTVTLFIECNTTDKRDFHCFVGWVNNDNSSPLVYQQIHLTGGPGSYNVYIPYVANVYHKSTLKTISIGEMTKEQRDKMNEIAKQLGKQMKEGIFDGIYKEIFETLGGKEPMTFKTRKYNCQDWLLLYLRVLESNGFDIPTEAYNLIENTGAPVLSTN